MIPKFVLVALVLGVKCKCVGRPSAHVGVMRRPSSPDGRRIRRGRWVGLIKRIRSPGAPVSGERRQALLEGYVSTIGRAISAATAVVSAPRIEHHSIACHGTCHEHEDNRRHEPGGTKFALEGLL
jgi:hypothetical protein